jgi:hypothetical protein
LRSAAALFHTYDRPKVEDDSRPGWLIFSYSSPQPALAQSGKRKRQRE